MQLLARQHLVALLALLLLPALIGVEGYSYTLTATYHLYPDGTCHVVLYVYGVANKTVITLPLEEGYIPESVMVSTPSGTPLPYNTSGSSLVVYVGGVNGSITVSYDLVCGVAGREVVEYTIHPEAKAIVYLPPGSALLYTNDTPGVMVSHNIIVLAYSRPGTYTIKILSPATPLGAVGGGGVATPVEKHTATPRGGRKPTTIPVIVVALVVVVGALASILAAYSWWRRRGGSGAQEPTEIEVAEGLDERDKAIIDLLRREGPLSASEIARRLGYSKSTVHRRLHRLASMGLVERITRGRQVVYRVKMREGEV